MFFGKLANIFRAHAKEIKVTEDKTARFRINNYIHAAEVINATYSESTHVTLDRIKGLPLTDYMKARAVFFFKNPNIYGRVLTAEQKKIESMSKKDLLHDLLEVQGIGMSRAKELIKNGLTSISQLKTQKYYKELTLETRLFLKYPPITRIPRSYIEKIDKQIEKIRHTYDMTIVGSYRRGKAFSSDVDIMLVSDSPDSLNSLSEILPKILKMKLYVYSIGENKMSAIAVGDHTIKFDVFLVDKARAASMLLYSTGSKEFNIRMRSIAKQLGYMLNQNGLWRGKKRLNIFTERGFFDALSMPYVEPVDRI